MIISFIDRPPLNVLQDKHRTDAACGYGSGRQPPHLFSGRKADPLPAWIDDAIETDLTPIVRFARTLSRDFDAVKNVVEMPWSNGQAEGQINRLKTLKRAMYGRSGPELLRARMLPFRHTNQSRAPLKATRHQRRIILNNAMPITPMSPAGGSQGKGVTWVTSGWKSTCPMPLLEEAPGT